ncbi:hypothetical protein H6771_01665 [Candidatus Peribacteria bacterium]|nr:hypothetical protein [Candidatus Peribacteria bacterium]
MNPLWLVLLLSLLVTGCSLQSERSALQDERGVLFSELVQDFEPLKIQSTVPVTRVSNDVGMTAAQGFLSAAEKRAIEQMEASEDTVVLPAVPNPALEAELRALQELADRVVAEKRATVPKPIKALEQPSAPPEEATTAPIEPPLVSPPVPTTTPDTPLAPVASEATATPEAPEASPEASSTNTDTGEPLSETTPAVGVPTSMTTPTPRVTVGYDLPSTGGVLLFWMRGDEYTQTQLSTAPVQFLSATGGVLQYLEQGDDGKWHTRVFHLDAFEESLRQSAEREGR